MSQFLTNSFVSRLRLESGSSNGGGGLGIWVHLLYYPNAYTADTAAIAGIACQKKNQILRVFERCGNLSMQYA